MLPTDGEAPLDPDQGRKVADVDFEIVGKGVGTATADKGTPSNGGVIRSGSRAEKLLIVCIPLGVSLGV
jgi:hypothetical protein